jgi:molybdopterin converting factor small subunit
MEVKLKLFATLSDYLPADANRNEVALTLEDGVPIARVIERFKLPRSMVHLVLVNGVYVQPQDRASRPLKDGDVLAIWPPIAGG